MNSTPTVVRQLHSRVNDWRAHLVVTLAYVLLTASTVPFFMADTVGYAEAIAARRFTDFGHLGWYWIGYVCSELLKPLTDQEPSSVPSGRYT